MKRSQISSVAQEPWAPGMLNGLMFVGTVVELTMMSFCAPFGTRLIQVQKLRMPSPASSTVLPGSHTVWLKATRFLGCTMKP